jgi:hypothetical protein
MNSQAKTTAEPNRNLENNIVVLDDLGECNSRNLQQGFVR